MDDQKSFVEMCNAHRAVIKELAKEVLELKKLVTVNQETVDTTHDIGEMIANLMLSYRHLEDASMRLGKAIQAFDGGVSVYDKNSTVGANIGA